MSAQGGGAYAGRGTSAALPNPAGSAKIHMKMKSQYTAVVQRDGEWWIGWVEEVPGVNAQARTRRQLAANLRAALKEALAPYRGDALALAKGPYEEQGLEI